MSKFINPYAFIKLPDAKTIEKTQNEERFTGKIECSLYPRTPLFIPNTTYEKVFDKSEDHKSYDFYSYMDISKKSGDNSLHEPVIPGSSIRGEVRSLYEALTGSCFSTAGKDLVLYKRMPDPGQMGLLKKVHGSYELHEAEKYMACYISCNNDKSTKKFDGTPVSTSTYFDINALKLTEGLRVWFKPGKKYIKYIFNKDGSKKKQELYETVDEISKPMQPGFKEGYILKGEPFLKKHHFSIAHQLPTASKITNVSMIEIDMFKQVLNLYMDDRINKHIKKGHNAYKEYAQCFNNLQNGESIPVFYKTMGSGTTKYISPACISKEVYQNTVIELLKQSGLNPCEDKELLCPACSLFGMVGTNNLTAIPGRVRFSDAIMKRPQGVVLKDVFHKEITLKELSSPKVSSTEFYLRRPNASGSGNGADMWNYDYAFDWVKYRRGPKKSGYIPFLNGRKFYWQNKSFKWNSIIAPSRNKLNNTIRPINSCKKESGDGNPDYCFVFDVYFERLTKVELDRLIAVLRLGLDNNETGYHSIGHGKPYGMGSVKIEINAVKIRKLSINTERGRIERTFEEYSGLQNCQAQPLAQVFGNNRQVRQIMVICAVHDFTHPITYPEPTNGGFSYKWFVTNRGSNNTPSIQQTLPEIPDNANTLSDKELSERMALDKN